MANKPRLELDEAFIIYIETQPEKGMGYHLVNIELKNGTTLKNRVVLNSSLLELEFEEEISNDDIKSLKVID